MIQLGKLLRQRRKEMGMRIEDLTDTNISSATISNIERGKSSTHKNKLFYLCEKLGLNIESLPDLIKENILKKKQIKRKLESLEGILEFDPEAVLKELEIIPLCNLDLLSAYCEYLKGKCYINRKSWTNAKNHLVECIRIVEENEKALSKTNLKAASLNELGRVFYFNNDVHQALSCAERGIESFQEDGERGYYKQILYINKALYLDKLDETQESLKTLEVIWRERENIQKLDVLLNMFELRAILLYKHKLFADAMCVAQRGLSIAMINRQYDRVVELYYEIGRIHVQLNEWEEAKNCFETACRYEMVLKNTSLLIPSYIQMGLLNLKMKKVSQAETDLLKAVSLTKQDPNIWNYIEAHQALGDCYLERGDRTTALKNYQKAFSKCKEQNFICKQNDLLVKMCKCVEKSDKKLLNKYIENLYHIQVELAKRGGGGCSCVGAQNHRAKSLLVKNTGI